MDWLTRKEEGSKVIRKKILESVKEIDKEERKSDITKQRKEDQNEDNIDLEFNEINEILMEEKTDLSDIDEPS